MNGYILIHRKLLNWKWYSNINDTRLWLHCLLSVNWEDGWYEGIKIPRGSFVTGRKKLSKETGLSEQQIRTSLEHLKSTNEITIDTTHNFTIISINNYNKYQTINQRNNQSITNNQPINNHYINNTIKNNKEKENNNIYIVEIIDHLNLRTGQNYKYTTSKTISFINARLKEGFNVDDFKTVIDKMCMEWMNTDMQKYLRPETLFGTKFESYLNREIKPTTKNITLSEKSIDELFG